MANADESYIDRAKKSLLGFAGGIKRNLVDIPKEAGEAAYLEAGARNKGVLGEFSKADAAKHMAWQATMAQKIRDKTGVPDRAAVLAANMIGVGKEAIVDGLGSTAKYIAEGVQNGGKFNPENNPLPVMRNSLMDTRNNAVGAMRLINSKDIVGDAVRLSDESTSSVSDSIKNRAPYAER